MLCLNSIQVPWNTEQGHGSHMKWEEKMVSELSCGRWREISHLVKRSGKKFQGDRIAWARSWCNNFDIFMVKRRSWDTVRDEARGASRARSGQTSVPGSILIFSVLPCSAFNSEGGICVRGSNGSLVTWNVFRILYNGLPFVKANRLLSKKKKPHQMNYGFLLALRAAVSHGHVS